MTQIKKILLALDGGKAGDVVVARGSQLARCFDAELVLFHAFTDEISTSPDYVSGDASQKLRELVAGKMDGLVIDLIERGCNVQKSLIREGNPSELILSVANDMNSDLIVMGAARKNFVEKVFGGTAEKVVRKSEKPIWFVHPGESAKEIKTILCAVDFSPASAATMNTAIELCQHLDARLEILHVFPSLNDIIWYDNLYGPPYPGAAVPTPEIPDYDHSEDIEQFEKYTKLFDLAGIEYCNDLRYGSTQEEICRAVEATRCDLLVIGVFHHARIITYFLKGTIEKVLRKVPCSLLAVKHSSDPVQRYRNIEIA